jgi:hypothetical protein
MSIAAVLTHRGPALLIRFQPNVIRRRILPAPVAPDRAGPGLLRTIDLLQLTVTILMKFSVDSA